MSPRIGMVANITDVDKKTTRLAVIHGGSYLGDYGRVSNFWYWRYVKTDGTLGVKEHSGYNNSGPFSIEEAAKFETKITVVRRAA